MKTYLAPIMLTLALPALAATSTTSLNWQLQPSGAFYTTEANCIAAVPTTVNAVYHCIKDTTVTVSGVVAPPPPPPPAPTGAVVFETNFDATEFPLSEGGKWRRANNAWTSVRTSGGYAYGTNGVSNGYDDSYALLSGFGPNQTVEATVQRSANLANGITHEVELLLRFSDDTNNARGYEALFNYEGGFEIVRWNGAYGSFTPLSFNGATGYLGRQLQTGDVVKATAIGSTITLYINGQFMAKAIDSTFSTGQPGISFFTRPGGNSANLGLSRYKASSN